MQKAIPLEEAFRSVVFFCAPAADLRAERGHPIAHLREMKPILFKSWSLPSLFRARRARRAQNANLGSPEQERKGPGFGRDRCHFPHHRAQLRLRRCSPGLRLEHELLRRRAPAGLLSARSFHRSGIFVGGLPGWARVHGLWSIIPPHLFHDTETYRTY